jgi:hypothetical protein
LDNRHGTPRLCLHRALYGPSLRRSLAYDF